jgi:hypothetical protein
VYAWSSIALCKALLLFMCNSFVPCN